MIRQVIILLSLFTMAGLLTGCGEEPPAAVSPGVSSGGDSRPAPPPARLHQVIEAEAMSVVAAPMAIVEEAETSGGQCVRIPAGLAADAPLTGRLETTIDVPSDVEAKVWYRVHWSGTCANSLTMTIGGMPEFIVGEDGTYKAWHWVSTPPVPLTAGEQTIVIGQREEDVAIDQILITQDLQYIPMGIEE